MVLGRFFQKQQSNNKIDTNNVTNIDAIDNDPRQIQLGRSSSDDDVNNLFRKKERKSVLRRKDDEDEDSSSSSGSHDTDDHKSFVTSSDDSTTANHPFLSDRTDDMTVETTTTRDVHHQIKNDFLKDFQKSLSQKKLQSHVCDVADNKKDEDDSSTSSNDNNTDENDGDRKLDSTNDSAIIASNASTKVEKEETTTNKTTKTTTWGAASWFSKKSTSNVGANDINNSNNDNDDAYSDMFKQEVNDKSADVNPEQVEEEDDAHDDSESTPNDKNVLPGAATDPATVSDNVVLSTSQHQNEAPKKTSGWGWKTLTIATTAVKPSTTTKAASTTTTNATSAPAIAEASEEVDEALGNDDDERSHDSDDESRSEEEDCVDQETEVVLDNVDDKNSAIADASSSMKSSQHQTETQPTTKKSGWGWKTLTIAATATKPSQTTSAFIEAAEVDGTLPTDQKKNADADQAYSRNDDSDSDSPDDDNKVDHNIQNADDKQSTISETIQQQSGESNATSTSNTIISSQQETKKGGWGWKTIAIASTATKSTISIKTPFNTEASLSTTPPEVDATINDETAEKDSNIDEKRADSNTHTNNDDDKNQQVDQPVVSEKKGGWGWKTLTIAATATSSKPSTNLSQTTANNTTNSVVATSTIPATYDDNESDDSIGTSSISNNEGDDQPTPIIDAVYIAVKETPANLKDTSSAPSIGSIAKLSLWSTKNPSTTLPTESAMLSTTLHEQEKNEVADSFSDDKSVSDKSESEAEEADEENVIPRTVTTDITPQQQHSLPTSYDDPKKDMMTDIVDGETRKYVHPTTRQNQHNTDDNSDDDSDQDDNESCTSDKSNDNTSNRNKLLDDVLDSRALLLRATSRLQHGYNDKDMEDSESSDNSSNNNDDEGSDTSVSTGNNTRPGTEPFQDSLRYPISPEKEKICPNFSGMGYHQTSDCEEVQPLSDATSPIATHVPSKKIYDNNRNDDGKVSENDLSDDEESFGADLNVKIAVASVESCPLAAVDPIDYRETCSDDDRSDANQDSETEFSDKFKYDERPHSNANIDSNMVGASNAYGNDSDDTKSLESENENTCFPESDMNVSDPNPNSSSNYSVSEIKPCIKMVETYGNQDEIRSCNISNKDYHIMDDFGVEDKQPGSNSAEDDLIDSDSDSENSRFESMDKDNLILNQSHEIGNNQQCSVESVVDPKSLEMLDTDNNDDLSQSSSESAKMRTAKILETWKETVSHSKKENENKFVQSTSFSECDSEDPTPSENKSEDTNPDDSKVPKRVWGWFTKKKAAQEAAAAAEKEREANQHEDQNKAHDVGQEKANPSKSTNNDTIEELNKSTCISILPESLDPITTSSDDPGSESAVASSRPETENKITNGTSQSDEIEGTVSTKSPEATKESDDKGHTKERNWWFGKKSTLDENSDHKMSSKGPTNSKNQSSLSMLNKKPKQLDSPSNRSDSSKSVESVVSPLLDILMKLEDSKEDEDTSIQASPKSKKKKKSANISSMLENDTKARKISRHGDEVSVGTMNVKKRQNGRDVVLSSRTEDVIDEDEFGSRSRPWESTLKKVPKRSHKSKQQTKPKPIPVDEFNSFPSELEDLLKTDVFGNTDDFLQHVKINTSATNPQLPSFHEEGESDHDNSVAEDDREIVNDIDHTAVDSNVIDNLHESKNVAHQLNELGYVDSPTVLDFDEMWDNVSCDGSTAIEFDRIKRKKHHEKEKKRQRREQEKDDRSHSARRLRLFERKKEMEQSSEQAGSIHKKNPDQSKLSNEFVDAIHKVFDDGSVNSAASSHESRDDADRHDSQSANGSCKSLYLPGDEEPEQSDHNTNDEESFVTGNDTSKRTRKISSDDTVNDGIDSVLVSKVKGKKQGKGGNKSKAHNSNKGKKKKKLMKRSEIDSSEIFLAEVERLKRPKVLTIASLRQEMIDRRGTSVNLVKKEYVNYRKKRNDRRGKGSGDNELKPIDFSTLSGQMKNNSHMDNSKNDIFGTTTNDSRDDSESVSKRGGLGAKLSRWKKTEGITELDDLATVVEAPVQHHSILSTAAAFAKNTVAHIPDVAHDVQHLARDATTTIATVGSTVAQTGQVVGGTVAKVGSKVVHTTGSGLSHGVQAINSGIHTGANVFGKVSHGLSSSSSIGEYRQDKEITVDDLQSLQGSKANSKSDGNDDNNFTFAASFSNLRLSSIDEGDDDDDNDDDYGLLGKNKNSNKRSGGRDTNSYDGSFDHGDDDDYGNDNGSKGYSSNNNSNKSNRGNTFLFKAPNLGKSIKKLVPKLPKRNGGSNGYGGMMM